MYKQFYTTTNLHNVTQLHQTSYIFKTLPNDAKLNKILQHVTKPFTTLHHSAKPYEIITKLYATNSTQLYTTLQHFYKTSKSSKTKSYKKNTT